MASTGTCPFCGAVVTSEEKKCPNCGGENPNYVRDQVRQIVQPKTLDELKEYCAERGMPLLRMRFFIGVNTQEPRAFGIYREGSRFIVYKNKSDGSRAVRYNGTDEAYAVNEIYTKLIEECHSRGIYPDQPGKPAAQSSTAAGWKSANEEWMTRLEKQEQKKQEERKKEMRKTRRIIAVIAVLFFVLLIVFARYSGPGRGTSSSSDWDTTTNRYSYTQENRDSTRNSYSYSHDNDRDHDSWDSDWGSNDYDSWDSGSTDWDSDW